VNALAGCCCMRGDFLCVCKRGYFGIKGYILVEFPSSLNQKSV
jgi:hypothetical protein